MVTILNSGFTIQFDQTELDVTLELSTNTKKKRTNNMKLIDDDFVIIIFFLLLSSKIF